MIDFQKHFEPLKFALRQSKYEHTSALGDLSRKLPDKFDSSGLKLGPGSHVWYLLARFFAHTLSGRFMKILFLYWFKFVFPDISFFHKVFQKPDFMTDRGTYNTLTMVWTLRPRVLMKLKDSMVVFVYLRPPLDWQTNRPILSKPLQKGSPLYQKCGTLKRKHHLDIWISLGTFLWNLGNHASWMLSLSSTDFLYWEEGDASGSFGPWRSIPPKTALNPLATKAGRVFWRPKVPQFPYRLQKLPTSLPHPAFSNTSTN